MKTLTFLVGLIFALTLHLHAQGGSVRVDVVQNVKSNGSAKNGVTTQSRTLVVTLNNNSKVQMDNLTMKYWFFTREVKGGGGLSVHKTGENKVSLGPVGKQVLTTENVTNTYTAQHSEVTSNQVRGANGQMVNVPNIKRVEASGQKIVGYAVRVFDGEKIVGEYYSEPSLKQKMGDTNAALKAPGQ